MYIKDYIWVAMRLLVHSLYFPPEVGGLETHVLTLCQALLRRGHEVFVVTSRSQPGLPREEVYEGVPVRRVFCPGKNPLGWVTTSFAAAPLMYRLARSADVIHVHTFPSIVPAVPPRRLMKVPLVATIHTSHFLRLAKKGAWRPVLRFLLKQPDLLLAPSIEIRDVCLSLVPSADAHALVNAVDVERFRPVEPAIERRGDEKIVVVPRRLFHKNGVEFAIRALPLVRRRFNAHLYLIGDGPLREPLQKLASELGVGEFVHFLGKKPNAQMPAYLSSADVVVIPSLMEATSVAGLEAMACERVVVASDVGGLPEIVSSETGRLARPADPEDLAERICEVLSLPDAARAQMGRRAREVVVSRWSTDALAAQVERFYEKAIEKVRG